MIDSQRGPQGQVGYNQLISNKREWKIILLKTPQNIDRSSQLKFVRTNGIFKNTFGLTRLHSSYLLNSCCIIQRSSISIY